MMGSDGGMVFGGGFMWIVWILLIVLLAVIVRAMAGGTPGPGTSGTATPEDILKQRYARGEIDEQELEHRLRELKK